MESKNADKAPISADKMPINADKAPISADKAPINVDKAPVSADKMPVSADKAPIKRLSKQEILIIDYLQRNEKITTSTAGEVLGVKQRRARGILKELAEKNVLLKRGAYKSTVYVLNAKENLQTDLKKES